jgi:hypothetical protein
MTVVGYLDAGSGSMLVGAVAAAGAGVAVAAKVGWRRVAGAFGGKGKSGTEAETRTDAVGEDAPEAAATETAADAEPVVAETTEG